MNRFSSAGILSERRWPRWQWLLLALAGTLGAQEAEPPPDTLVAAPPPAAAAPPPATDTIPLSLEYGYKGFPWGSLRGTIPTLAYMDSAVVEGDSSIVSLYGNLGPDSVQIDYFFADSGFWKVEINFYIDQNDLDSQVKQFTRLEMSISQVYGPPQRTTQVISGVGGSYSNTMHPRFSRAFYRSSWDSIPVKIELLLNSLVEVPVLDLALFHGDLSFLKLVYANPDYMYLVEPIPEAVPLPSIFEIY